MEDDKNKNALTEEQLEEVSGGQTEESVIPAHTEKVAEMKKMQSRVITSAGTMAEIVATIKR